MKNCKAIVLSLSALALMACGQDAPAAESPAAESQQTESAAESAFEPSQAPTVENLDEGPTAPDDSQETESKETASEADSQEAEASEEAEPAATDVAVEEPADSKDLNIIEYVKSADSSIPEDAQFYIGQLSDTLYQIEVRQEGADPMVSNLFAIYQYDSENDEIKKQDPTTGEFVDL